MKWFYIVTAVSCQTPFILYITHPLIHYCLIITNANWMPNEIGLTSLWILLLFVSIRSRTVIAQSVCLSFARAHLHHEEVVWRFDRDWGHAGNERCCLPVAHQSAAVRSPGAHLHVHTCSHWCCGTALSYLLASCHGMCQPTVSASAAITSTTTDWHEWIMQHYHNDHISALTHWWSNMCCLFTFMSAQQWQSWCHG